MEPLIEERLRRLSTVCMALAGSVGLYALLIVLLIELSGKHPWDERVGTLPFLFALGGFLVTLISSAVRASLLRRGREAVEDEAPGREEALGRLLGTFQSATLTCFALLEGAAILGLISAWLSGTSFYGLLVSATALYAMIVRWPRRASFEVFREGVAGGAGGMG